MTTAILYRPGAMSNLDLSPLDLTANFYASGSSRLTSPTDRSVEVFSNDYSLTYRDDHSLQSGFVSRLVQFEGAEVQIDLFNFRAPIDQLLALSRTSDPQARANFFFGGDDLVVGSRFGDQISGGAGADYIDGGDGIDYIDGDSGADTVVAGDGDDVVRGLADNDQLYGGAGQDILSGNTGMDTLFGGDGKDTVYGGQGNDLLVGGDDNDILFGNIASDEVLGGAGADVLYGGQGDDTLRGEDGDDVLAGDIGTDLLFGGLGIDRFVFGRGGGQDWIADFNGEAGERVLLAPGVGYTLTSYLGQARIQLSSGDAIGLAGIDAETFDHAWVVVG